MTTFVDGHEPVLLQVALACVRETLQPHQTLDLEQIDGVVARESSLVSVFEGAGFTPSYRGLRTTGWGLDLDQQ